jgi:hypothetical protein
MAKVQDPAKDVAHMGQLFGGMVYTYAGTASEKLRLNLDLRNTNKR